MLAALVLACFWPALLGGFVADDILLIAHNPALQTRDLAALLGRPLLDGVDGYWRPLTMLVLLVGDSLGGAFGVHLLSLSLHMANVLLVRALAGRVLPARASTFVALVFALHPVQVEAVAWCAAINDQLWVACALAAMAATARWRERGGAGWPWAVAPLVLLALLGKETGAAAIPLTIAAALWLAPARAPRPGLPLPPAAVLAARVALLALLGGAAWALLRAAVLGEGVGAVLLRAGATGAADAPPGLAWWQVLVAQCELLVQPFPLSPMRRAIAPGAATVVVAVAIAAVLVLLAWRAGSARRRLRPATDAAADDLAGPAAAAPGARTDRGGDAARRLALAATLVLAPLAPTLLHRETIGVFPIADRYLYLPVAGLALAVASALPAFAWSRRAWLLPVALAVPSFAATWNWRDLGSYTAHAVATAPAEPMALVMAAEHQLDLAAGGDVFARRAAEDHFRRALRHLADAPTGEQMRRCRARARLGLAWSLLLRAQASGDCAGVVAAFHAAVDSSPEAAAAWVGLGVAHLAAGERDAAAAAFREALHREPGHPGARRGLEQLAALGAAAR